MSVATPNDVATFLGQDIDDVMAQWFIDQAESLCSAVVDPLPDAALPVIVRVAARGLSNSSGAQQMSLGSAQVSFGSQAATYNGGLFLSKDDRTSLLRLVGRGGAFTIDPTPDDAGTGLAPWAQNVDFPYGIPTLGDGP